MCTYSSFCSVDFVLSLVCCSCLLHFLLFFFFKQKTAYEMRISDWSSDVCSSDLALWLLARRQRPGRGERRAAPQALPHAGRHLRHAACADPHRRAAPCDRL